MGKVIELKSPSGLKVVGALGADGSICEIECHYDYVNGEHSFIYVVPENMSGTLARRNGERVFVDTSGTQWSASDVEFVSARGPRA